MANLLRLIAFVLAFAAGPAHALFPVGTLYNMSNPRDATKQVSSGSKEGVCNAWMALFNWDPNKKIQSMRVVGSECQWTYKWGSTLQNTDTYSAGFSSSVGCPSNAISAGNGNCACANGLVENPVGGGERCVSDDLAKCGLHDAFWGATGNNRDVQLPGNVRDVQFCYPTPDMSPGKGCAMKLDWQMSFQKPDGGWVSEGVGVTNDSPSVCTLGDEDKEGEKDDCKGGYKGTVNGVETCVPVKPADGVDSKVDKTETTEKTEPDGSKTTTKTETKTTTNCGADGKCTSTTTTTTTTTNPTDPTKNTTNTTTKTETSDAGSHCAKNKTAPECKGTGDDGEKSEFNGSCESGFQCKGDAIQCAMAKEQHKRMCTLFEDKTQESDLYETEKAKDPKRDVTKDLEGNEEIDIASKLSNADALGGGSCVQDLNITVMSTSVTLPLSRLCSVLAQLGYLLIAVSSLAAARILMKA